MTDFHIRRITRDDIETVLKFLRVSFFPNEPCAKALNLCPRGYQIPALEDDIVDILKKGISLAAFAIDDPAKIVGVAVLDEKVKGQKEPTDNKRTYPETFKKLEGFFVDLSTVFGSYDIFEALKVNKILDVYIVCTSPETGGKGLATAMIHRGLDESSTEGHEAAQCMALSIYTQKICARLGFETVSRLNYSEYCQGKYGHIFRSSEMGPHTHGVYCVKKY